MTLTFLTPRRGAAIALAIALFAPGPRATAQSADVVAPAGDATNAATDAAAETTDAAADAAQPAATTDSSTTANPTTSDATIAVPDAGAASADASTVPQTGGDAQLDATAAGQADASAQSASGQQTDASAQPGQPGQPQNQPPNTQSRTSSGAQIQTGAQTQAGVATQPQLGQTSAAGNADLGLQFGAATERGLTVNAIDRASILASSGLRARDVLVSFSGQPVRSYADFQRYVVRYPGQRVPVVILRDGRQQTIYITAPAQSVAQRPGMPGTPVAQASLGVTFDPQVPNMAVVREVRPSSPAEHAGLRPGDVINALNGQRTANPQQVIQVVGQMQPGQEVQIDFSRRATVVLVDNSPARHTVGYAPTTQPAIVQPAPPQTRVLVPSDDPDTVVVPGGQRRGLDRRDFDDDGDIIRPGDADRDGRVLDGDGRLRQRDND
jgi:membrane-associated protease RseP (regulator of RpoE activity)